MGCDTKSRTNTNTDISFQSTHPHGVRPADGGSTDDVVVVSIHAPTWGATHRRPPPLSQKFVSIHAPTWGATRGGLPQYRRFSCFNPRTHMGCDVRNACANLSESVFQSTHPHGVRRQSSKALRFRFGFNPRTHMGCDLTLFKLIRRLTRFNPRTHMGCDTRMGNS